MKLLPRSHRTPSDGPSVSNYVLITLTTVALLAATFALLVSRFGSGISPSDMADMHARNPDMVALPFDLRYYSAYKLRRAEWIAPELVVLGSSRGGSFQAKQFAPHAFYNMSFTAWTFEQLTDEFERLLQVVHPRIVILPLDFFMFSDQWESSSNDRAMIYDQPRYLKTSIANLLRTLYVNPNLLSQAIHSSFLGIQAMSSKEGFRADGSYLYSTEYINYSAERRLNGEFFISSFPGGATMSEDGKAQLKRFASLARERNVTLVAIQLPILTAAVDILDHSESYHPYAGVWRAFGSPANRAWLEGLGIHFFDLSHSDMDQDPSYFIDAAHLSEKGMAELITRLHQDAEFSRIVWP